MHISPVEPYDPIVIMARLPPVHVYPIQVTMETVVKPPATIMPLGTVMTGGRILISVLSREALTIVIVKAVPWKRKQVVKENRFSVLQ